MYYHFDQEYLKTQTEAKKAALKEVQPDAIFNVYASDVIASRLRARIDRYLVYGVYWYALKEVLRRNGHEMIGDETDAVMAEKYKGSDDSETLVAAELFYEALSGQVAVDNREWQIDDDTTYTLYDPDMEERTALNQVPDPFTST